MEGNTKKPSQDLSVPLENGGARENFDHLTVLQEAPETDLLGRQYDYAADEVLPDDIASQVAHHKAAQATREAARIARIKYRAGDTTFLDVLIVEERLLANESDAIVSRANVAKNAIALHTALGLQALPTDPVKVNEVKP